MERTKGGPILTVDALIEDEQGRILLIKRAVPPFKGDRCLPGGKVENGERVEAALEREIMEELGVRIGIRELFGVYSDPDRDPRGHYITVVFHATIVGGEPTTSSEVDEIYWLSRNDQDIPFGFDHGKILQDWWNRRVEGGVLPSQETVGRKEPARMREHPVDRKVAQTFDERIEGAPLVEDEAGRGKRVTSTASDRKGRMAVPRTGSGSKKTVPAGKAAGVKNTARKR